MISKEDIEKVLENLQNAGMTRDEIGAAIGYKDENGINAAKARLAKDPSKFYNALCLLYENWILKNVINEGGRKVNALDKSGAEETNSDAKDQLLKLYLSMLASKHRAMADEIDYLLKEVSLKNALESDIWIPMMSAVREEIERIEASMGKVNKAQANKLKP